MSTPPPRSSTDRRDASPPPQRPDEAARDALITDHFPTAELLEFCLPIARPGQVALETMLDAVREFGTASLELMAWEFGVHKRALWAHWELCRRERLIICTGLDPIVGEAMYRLTAKGATFLRSSAATPPPIR